MYCNPKNKCNYLIIKPGNTLHGRPTGFCELANVSLDINVHPDKPHPDKPHPVFFKRLPNCNHFSTAAIPPPTQPIHYCIDGGECYYLDISSEVEPLSNDRKAMCSRHKQQLTYDPMMMNFIPSPQCKAIVNKNEPPAMQEQTCRERFFQDFPKHNKSIDDHLNSPKASPSTDEVMSHNVGDSNYAKKKIQPWHIWEEYLLNPWDADIVKRILRDKESQSRREDYEKIIHDCQKRISQIDDGVEGLS